MTYTKDNNISNPGCITLRFFGCNYQDFYSRLIQFGLRLNRQNDTMCHVTIEIGDEGYDITMDGIETYDADSKLIQRWIRKNCLVSVVLVPQDNHSLDSALSNVRQLVKDGVNIDPHTLIDWVMGDDTIQFCTDHIMKGILNYEQPYPHLPYDLSQFFIELDGKYLDTNSGTYKIHSIE